MKIDVTLNTIYDLLKSYPFLEESL